MPSAASVSWRSASAEWEPPDAPSCTGPSDSTSLRAPPPLRRARLTPGVARSENRGEGDCAMAEPVRPPDILSLHAKLQPQKLAVVHDSPDGKIVRWSFAELEAQA